MTIHCMDTSKKITMFLEFLIGTVESRLYSKMVYSNLSYIPRNSEFPPFNPNPNDLVIRIMQDWNPACKTAQIYQV